MLLKARSKQRCQKRVLLLRPDTGRPSYPTSRPPSDRPPPAVSPRCHPWRRLGARADARVRGGWSWSGARWTWSGSCAATTTPTAASTTATISSRSRIATSYWKSKTFGFLMYFFWF